MFKEIIYKDLNKLQIGNIGEYFVKLNFTLLGFDTFTTEVDDKGIDFVIRLNSNKYIDIQVKTIRDNNKFVSIPKKGAWENLDNDNLYLVLVLLHDGLEPDVYLINSKEWQTETNLFRDRNYEKVGQKSKPEWALNVSKKNLIELKEFEIIKVINKIR